jgi:hypothetical protein
VVTTINKPTKAIEVLHEKFGSNLIVVGDKKTPAGWEYKDTKYISPNKEPFNSYARKNFGYLEAMRMGSELIYDTDDDNIPNKKWRLRQAAIRAIQVSSIGWVNVYNNLSEEILFWARGFPLNKLNSTSKEVLLTEDINSSIQQGVADGEPDVDAIWRLIFNKKIDFKWDKSIFLTENSWSPFNSQSTWFFKKAFPLMYLPVHATFRMCDIWRSFIAQKCLWQIGEGVTFHSPSEVFQDRNEHDLLKDFEDEIPGYLKNDLIVEILSSLKLKQGEENMCDNLLKCYHALVEKNILPLQEISSVIEWITDYENAIGNI